MRSERPRIWIDPELVVEGLARVSLPVRYAEAVWDAGGLPAVLPPLGRADFLDELLPEIDGLLLSGGDDFETERLGQGPTHPAAKPVPGEKQDFDLRLVRGALERGIPVLGICYGMQLLGLAAKARLHQHLPEDRPEGQEHRGGVVHEVSLEAGSKLAGFLGVARLDVVSRHHQALAEPGNGWRVAGRDAEGLIEAIEHDALPFAVGVQWHPELSANETRRDVNERLFAAFVEAARRHSRARGIEPEMAAR